MFWDVCRDERSLGNAEINDGSSQLLPLRRPRRRAVSFSDCDRDRQQLQLRAVSEHDVMCFGTLNRAAPLKSRGLHRRHVSLVLLTPYFAPIIYSDSQLEYRQTVSGSTRNGLPRSTGISNGIYGQLL